jgi:hypothetical protein
MKQMIAIRRLHHGVYPLRIIVAGKTFRLELMT